MCQWGVVNDGSQTLKSEEESMPLLEACVEGLVGDLRMEGQDKGMRAG